MLSLNLLRFINIDISENSLMIVISIYHGLKLQCSHFHIHCSLQKPRCHLQKDWQFLIWNYVKLICFKTVECHSGRDGHVNFLKQVHWVVSSKEERLSWGYSKDTLISGNNRRPELHRSIHIWIDGLVYL